MVKSFKIIDKIGLCFLVALLISRAFLFVFEENFDAETWKYNPKKRYTMVDNIVESKLLINKTPTEVKQLLGTCNTTLTEQNNVLIYSLGTPPYFFNATTPVLIVMFSNQKVKYVAHIED